MEIAFVDNLLTVRKGNIYKILARNTWLDRY